MTTALELSTYLQTLPPDTTIEVLSVDSSGYSVYTSWIDLEFNIDSLRISECDDDDGYGNGVPAAGWALLNYIKKRNTVVDSAPGKPIAKVHAEVQSSKLRSLLNTLPE